MRINPVRLMHRGQQHVRRLPWRNPDGPDTDAHPFGEPRRNVVPDINATGARPGRKDILVEVNALYTPEDSRHGKGTLQRRTTAPKILISSTFR